MHTIFEAPKELTGEYLFPRCHVSKSGVHIMQVVRRVWNRESQPVHDDSVPNSSCMCGAPLEFLLWDASLYSIKTRQWIPEQPEAFTS